MSVVVALLLGLGVFLVYDGLTRTRSASTRPSIGDRGSSWLAAGGLGGCQHRSVRPREPRRPGFGAAAVVLVVIGSVGSGAGRGVGRRRGADRATTDRVVARCGRRGAGPGPTRSSSWPARCRAGDTLPAAIGVVAERGPESLRSVFHSVLSDHRVTGDLVGALERMGAVVADPIADRIVRTLVLAHHVGGRELGRVLRTLSAFLREDVASRREIEARQSWTVVAARVSAAAPWLVLVLVASRPQGARAFDSLRRESSCSSWAQP